MSNAPNPGKKSFGTSLQANVDAVSAMFRGSKDLVIRYLSSDAAPGRAMALLFIDGIVDSDTINTNIMNPLMSVSLPPDISAKGDKLIAALADCVISIGSVQSVKSPNDAAELMLNGLCLLLAEDSSVALMADANGGEQRSVTVPQTQTVIRGPQHSFTENLKTNISLLRRIIRSVDLHVDIRTIGRQSHTNVGVIYIHGLAEVGVVREVYRRLEEIDIDAVLESGYIEEFIQDETFTLFPTLLNTERPDTVAAELLEGKVSIIVDGSPLALIAPTSFFAFFQSPDDFYQRYDIASFIRVIRYTAYAISMLLPSIYIAITTFHQEMLPTTLLISLAAQREGIPFPGLVEALLMEMTFEVLREAGLRMPRAIGPAISIVGALVLGQSAVQAGIVSAGMVIVVSFTAISNFVTPEFNMAATSRIIRFLLMLLAGIFGFFGIFLGVLFVMVHLASLRSFGVPYMTPLAPLNIGLFRDIFFRMPRWAEVFRPSDISKSNRRRGGSGKKPEHQRQSKKP
ncbi:spore germination protein [Paenibacillus sp. NEAU-GSW1]|uniref:spore germination protein n=1 Tax=Paenibacillus sp. NEAU-GSW1 TaxID=2682486 RepID=UPI0012E16AA5|nr:spore germination protein [Paenibacillus sp. NEAU-GSW1]MUT66293.1 spore germination protein [Paenibacillus sp. NEAU-GSW1]